MPQQDNDFTEIVPSFPLASWVTKSLALLLAGWLLALGGYDAWMTPPPWGDQTQYWLDLITQSLLLISMPWAVSLPGEGGWLLSVAQWSLPMVMAFWVGMGGRWLLLNPWRVFWTQRRGGHVVIWGLGAMGHLILQDHLRQGGRALLLRPPGRFRSGPCRYPGVGMVSCNPARGKDWKKAALTRAATLFAVSDNDGDNLRVLIEAGKFLVQSGTRRAQPLPIAVQIWDDAQRLNLEQELDRPSMQRQVELRLFSVQKLVIRRLFLDWPCDRVQILGAPQRNHILILGAGDWGRGIAFHYLRLAHFRHGVPPRVTFVDRQRDAEDRWLGLYPRAKEIGQVRFYRFAVQNDASLGQFLLEELWPDQPPNAIYVCLGNETATLTVGLLAKKILEGRGLFTPPIHVHIQDRANFRSRLEQNPEISHGILPFGLMPELFDNDMVLLTRVDEIARIIHHRYLSEEEAKAKAEHKEFKLGAWASLVPWEELAEWYREENRLVADHYGIKMRDLHVRATQEKASIPWLFTQEALSETARAEHVRWCANRWLHNWKHAPQRKDEYRLHHNLIPFEQLGKGDQEKDLKIVRDLPDLMAELKTPLRREWRVAVHGESVIGDLAGQGEEIRAFLRRHMPAEASAVLLIPFHRSGARAAARWALKNRIPFHLLLVEPPAMTGQKLVRGESTEGLDEMFSRCDRIFVAADERGVFDPGLADEFVRRHGHAMIGVGGETSMPAGLPEDMPVLALPTSSVA